MYRILWMDYLFLWHSVHYTFNYTEKTLQLNFVIKWLQKYLHWKYAILINHASHALEPKLRIFY